MSLNTETLLDRILVARPNATLEDVRVMAPALSHLSEAKIAARIAKARRRRNREQQQKIDHHRSEEFRWI